jgi:hypothetical protein
MSIYQRDADFLEHYGVKGMKWGQRRQGRKEHKQVNKVEKQILKKAAKAKTPEEKKVLADRYQKEVVDRMNSDNFKKKYQAANTMGKGEAVALLILTAGTSKTLLDARNVQYARNRADGPSAIKRETASTLRDLRKGT